MSALPTSLKVAFALAVITCTSLVIFAIGAQIFNTVGWPPLSYWSDLVFESLTIIFWISAVATAVATLIAAWATRRYLISLQWRLSQAEQELAKVRQNSN